MGPGFRRPDVAIAFVIDRSGSMGGGKLRRALTAVREALGRLEAHDLFAVVSYANSVTVDVAMGPANDERVQGALAALERLRPSGGTALYGGWKTGCEEVARELESVSQGRVMLLTDGQSNVDVKADRVMWREAALFRAEGVFTSSFGLGLDFQEELLEGMACHGGGAFYYIERSAQVEEMFDMELGERLRTTAGDVRVKLELAPTLECRLLTRFASHAQFRSIEVAVGDMCADQVLSLIFELRTRVEFTPGPFPVTVSVRCASGPESIAVAPRQVWLGPRGRGQVNDKALRGPLARQVAALYAARERQRALQHNRAGQGSSARERLQQAARYVELHIGSSQDTEEIISALRQDALRFSTWMTEGERKTLFYDANTQLSSRRRDGSSRLLGGT